MKRETRPEQFQLARALQKKGGRSQILRDARVLFVREIEDSAQLLFHSKSRHGYILRAKTDEIYGLLSDLGGGRASETEAEDWIATNLAKKKQRFRIES